MYLYVKQNTHDDYEDIIAYNSDYLKNNNDYLKNNINDVKNNIGSLFKLTNNNHTILILSKNKYSNIFSEINIIKMNIVKINLTRFNNKNIHNNLKHKRIKINELNNLLNLI